MTGLSNHEHNRLYGKGHRARRAYFRPLVEQGRVDCWRCGKRITGRNGGRVRPQDWDLGHREPPLLSAPEHRTCNRGTSAHAQRSRSTGCQGPNGPGQYGCRAPGCECVGVDWSAVLREYERRNPEPDDPEPTRVTSW